VEAPVVETVTAEVKAHTPTLVYGHATAPMTTPVSVAIPASNTVPTAMPNELRPAIAVSSQACGSIAPVGHAKSEMTVC
ncbi:hypothetical protein, partial [Pseudoalteromonas denitrificans]